MMFYLYIYIIASCGYKLIGIFTKSSFDAPEGPDNKYCLPLGPVNLYRAIMVLVIPLE